MILFGIPATKDEAGSGAYDDEGVVQMAVRALKEAHPDLTVITDVCLCEYTSHGHCGFVRDGEVDNDITLELLAKTAISHAEAGADVVAPSDMMDGRVGMIRHQLDEEGHPDTAIIAYSRQVRVGLLRPVPRGGRVDARVRRPPRLPDGPGERPRGAARGAARRRGGRRHGDGQARAPVPRRDPPRSSDETEMPIAAYQVSGEYSMLKAAAEQRLDRRARRGARDADRDPPRGRRRDPHLLREGGRRVAGVTAEAPQPKAPLAQGRRGDPARRDRQAADEPAAVELPARRPSRTRSSPPRPT